MNAENQDIVWNSYESMLETLLYHSSTQFIGLSELYSLSTVAELCPQITKMTCCLSTVILLTNSEKEQISLWATSILYNISHIEECIRILRQDDTCLCNLARVLSVRPSEDNHSNEEDPTEHMTIPSDVTFNVRQYAFLTLNKLLKTSEARNRFCRL